MKFSILSFFLLLVGLIAVLCVPVDAQESSDACDMGPDLQYLCGLTEVQMDRMLEQALENVALVDPRSKDLGTTAARRRHQGLAKRNIFSDIKDYFVTYWNSLKLIFQGKFGEGIFNQLKNSGSWCEKNNWIVKAAKAFINKLSGGGLSVICDCLYPLVQRYDSFDQLGQNIERDAVSVLAKCPQDLKRKFLDMAKGSKGK
ncbi:hypothetical protein BGX28_004791 [Mortierella sp. GBA30]|nr:hypothetical protein BGX28_004791 [Mortierella sp. GBA30]